MLTASIESGNNRRPRLKSKQPRSEGVRELVFACSVTLSGLWTFIMGCLSLSHFLTTRDGIESLTMLFFTLIGGITLYLLPKGVCKFVYRIKSGTDLDKKGDEIV